MSFESDYIAKYREDAYRKGLFQARERRRLWRKNNPQEVINLSRNVNRKGGKYYKKKLIYDGTGLRYERNKIRAGHRRLWAVYKHIIAPGSQLHHEWLSGTADYNGVALVEADQHMHGIIDVIQILEGKITLLTEKEIRE